MIGGDYGRNGERSFGAVCWCGEGDLESGRHDCGSAQVFSLQKVSEPRVLHGVVCKCGSREVKAVPGYRTSKRLRAKALKLPIQFPEAFGLRTRRGLASA